MLLDMSPERVQYYKPTWPMSSLPFYRENISTRVEKSCPLEYLLFVINILKSSCNVKRQMKATNIWSRSWRMSSHLHLLKEWKKVSITPSWLSLIVSEKTLVWQTWCKSSGHGWLCVYCSVELWEPCWSVHIHDRKIANVFFEANCHNHACVYYMYMWVL